MAHSPKLGKADGQRDGSPQHVRSEELMYRIVDATSRRFHLSLSRNDSGLFLRLAASRVGQGRTRVIIPGQLLNEAVNVLENAFSAARTAPPSLESMEPVFSGRLCGGVKTYFVDVKDNERGRFLRISQVTNSGRAAIIVPEESIEGLVVAVKEMVASNRSAVEREVEAVEMLPPSHSVSSRTKRFHFDWENGRYGRYLRLTDHVGAKRTSIIIPEDMVRVVHSELDEIVREM